MISDLTVIYYTSNREKPAFEENVRASLLESIGHLPLISVSQKPIDFGENICIGNIGVSSHNAWKQFRTGCQKAKTKYVCSAESDSLYPKEYFEFRPQHNDVIYTPANVYVLFALRRSVKIFAKKIAKTDFGIIANRKHIIKKIQDNAYGQYLTKELKHEQFNTKDSVVSFKTDENMHRKTAYRSATKTRKIPHWGSSADLIRKYCR